MDGSRAMTEWLVVGMEVVNPDAVDIFSSRYLH